VKATTNQVRTLVTLSMMKLDKNGKALVRQKTTLPLLKVRIATKNLTPHIVVVANLVHSSHAHPILPYFRVLILLKVHAT
jgi:hypothetical protein